MTGQTKAPDRSWSIGLARGEGYAPFLLACALLATACASRRFIWLFPWIPFLHRWRLGPVTAMSLPVNGNMKTAPSSG